MNKATLSWKQVVGLEPVTQEEFRASIEAGLDEAEHGELIPAERAFAELERKYSKSAQIHYHAYRNG